MLSSWRYHLVQYWNVLMICTRLRVGDETMTIYHELFANHGKDAAWPEQGSLREISDLFFYSLRVRSYLSLCIDASCWCIYNRCNYMTSTTFNGIKTRIETMYIQRKYILSAHAVGQRKATEPQPETLEISSQVNCWTVKIRSNSVMRDGDNKVAFWQRSYRSVLNLCREGRRSTLEKRSMWNLRTLRTCDMGSAGRIECW